MGSIVKSIGKVIKKIGKGLKKVIKKIGPVLLIAAAVYAGVAFYGASLSAGTAAAGASTLGTTNFMTGIKSMGSSVMKFFSPAGTAPVASQAATAGMTGTGFQYGTLLQGQGGAAITGFETMAALNPAKTIMSSVSGGMTTGEALVYISKMNMAATGAKMVAGFWNNSEQEQRQHEKELLSTRYAYGKPSNEEQEAYLAANPNWIGEHPAMQQQDLYSSSNLMQSEAMASLPTLGTTPSPYVQQQTIGQPTFGRKGTREYGPSTPKALAGTKSGLITKGTQSVFKPDRTRGFV